MIALCKLHLELTMVLCRGASGLPDRPRCLLCAAVAEMKPGAALGKGAVDLAPWLLSSTSHEIANFILTVLHVLTYVPLVLLPAMQDAHLKLVIVLNTSLCLCLMTGNVLFHALGIVKVGVSAAGMRHPGGPAPGVLPPITNSAETVSTSSQSS